MIAHLPLTPPYPLSNATISWSTRLVLHRLRIDKSTRAIVFSHFRGSVQEIVQCLGAVDGIVPRYFIGQGGGKGDGPKGMSQKEQKALVKDFFEGHFNVLVATCIAEEGLDIGQVDLIVNYDTHKSPIRMIQRMGRTARKRTGRVVTLVTEQEKRKLDTALKTANSIQRALQNTQTFRGVVYRENPRMVPYGINPIMVKREMEVSEYRLSQVGGAKPSKESKARAKLQQKEYTAPLGNKRSRVRIGSRPQSSSDSSNSSNWKLTVEERIILETEYSLGEDEQLYVPNAASGWNRRVRFLRQRYGSSYGSPIYGADVYRRRGGSDSDSESYRASQGYGPSLRSSALEHIARYVEEKGWLQNECSDGTSHWNRSSNKRSRYRGSRKQLKKKRTSIEDSDDEQGHRISEDDNDESDDNDLMETFDGANIADSGPRTCSGCGLKAKGREIYCLLCGFKFSTPQASPYVRKKQRSGNRRGHVSKRQVDDGDETIEDRYMNNEVAREMDVEETTFIKSNHEESEQHANIDGVDELAEDVQVYDEQIATMPLDSAQSNTTGQDEKSSKPHSEIEPLSFLPSVKDMRKFARDIIFPSEATIENVGTFTHGEFSSWLVGPAEDRYMCMSEPPRIEAKKCRLNFVFNGKASGVARWERRQRWPLEDATNMNPTNSVSAATASKYRAVPSSPSCSHPNNVISIIEDRYQYDERIECQISSVPTSGKLETSVSIPNTYRKDGDDTKGGSKTSSANKQHDEGHLSLPDPPICSGSRVGSPFDAMKRRGDQDYFSSLEDCNANTNNNKASPHNFDRGDAKEEKFHTESSIDVESNNESRNSSCDSTFDSKSLCEASLSTTKDSMPLKTERKDVPGAATTVKVV